MSPPATFNLESPAFCCHLISVVYMTISTSSTQGWSSVTYHQRELNLSPLHSQIHQFYRQIYHFHHQYTFTIIKMSAPVGPLMQSLRTLPERGRQGVNNLRQRLFQQGEKPKKEGQILRTSFSVHRPVWITAGGGVYTSLAAVLLTMRYLKRV